MLLVSVCVWYGVQVIGVDVFVRFAVYDLDNATKTLEDDDFLGRVECTLGEVRVEWWGWEGGVVGMGGRRVGGRRVERGEVRMWHRGCCGSLGGEPEFFQINEVMSSSGGQCWDIYQGPLPGLRETDQGNHDGEPPTLAPG